MTVTLNLDAATTDSYTRRTLSDISLAVAKSKKIVVVTGAGISCSCGIPDFRSSDGLYALVKERYPDVVMKGRDLFDASLFRDPTSTAVFYTFISGLKRSIDGANPSPTHHFLKTLDNKKKLLRSYTQNIDGLEDRVGLLGSSCQEAKSSGKGKTKLRTKDVRNVQLHGDIHRVRCVACSADYPCTEEYLSCFEQGTPPDCPECLSRSEARVARSARATRVGSLRPGIVLYDETHPLGDDIGAIHSADLGRKPDLLVIMGTSLKVHGLKKLVKDFARTIHSNASNAASSSKKPFKVIFVNKTAPSSEWSDIIDYHVAGETDAWSNNLIEDWKKMRPADWEIQQTLVGDDSDQPVINGGLKAIKSIASGSSIAKPRKPFAGRENIAPLPMPSEPDDLPAHSKTKAPPLSPSKRRQKASHYDDLESSPSKRQAKSEHVRAMPAGERKTLFSEKINVKSSQPQSNDVFGDADRSKMDISLCDLSIKEVETSKMDVSVLDLSMLDVESIIKEQPPPKPSRKVKPKPSETKRKPLTRSRSTTEKRVTRRTGAVAS
ncbi:DHS-like NAD/FAD-binding domain-containing protein [Crepidotus variabilis]|uniref:DHS-like NAD/FAD-binding domain-containing protein n=1 Tax=Crepidotus variabilis TaxID=179855 RepID=A0A9P6EES5_9AGAR|nr:DHS-like NAD/FAD-binding domain-containing protein [Crepidotus variabilis]